MAMVNEKLLFPSLVFDYFLLFHSAAAVENGDVVGRPRRRRRRQVRYDFAILPYLLSATYGSIITASGIQTDADTRDEIQVGYYLVKV